MLLVRAVCGGWRQHADGGQYGVAPPERSDAEKSDVVETRQMLARRVLRPRLGVVVAKTSKTSTAALDLRRRICVTSDNFSVVVVVVVVVVVFSLTYLRSSTSHQLFVNLTLRWCRAFLNIYLFNTRWAVCVLFGKRQSRNTYYRRLHSRSQRPLDNRKNSTNHQLTYCFIYSFGCRSFFGQKPLVWPCNWHTSKAKTGIFLFCRREGRKIFWWAYISVCLSTRTSGKSHTAEFHQILCMLLVTEAQSFSTVL